MSLSSFSLILGVFFYVFGFPLVFLSQKYLVWQRKMLKDENAMRLVGTAFAMIGALTLRRQWQDGADGEGFVILVAWIVLLKSVFLAWWPSKFSALRERCEDRLTDVPALQVFVGCMMVLLGALFTYLGLLLPS